MLSQLISRKWGGVKTAIKVSLSLVSLLLVIYSLSCSEDSLTKSSVQDVQFFAYQVAGCNHNSLGKTAINDSCFSYSFTDTLKVDFCVLGNCCPDSNRFVTNYEINSDTLFITVSDTAANLCRCICNYTIHLDISGLQSDSYLFYCNYDALIEYKEQVSK